MLRSWQHASFIMMSKSAVYYYMIFKCETKSHCIIKCVERKIRDALKIQRVGTSQGDIQYGGSNLWSGCSDLNRRGWLWYNGTMSLDTR